MASTSCAGSHMADASTCPVCCGTFNTPKMLPCGHSFCLEPCLKTLLEASSPSCPLCRQHITLQSSATIAENFPTNFALQSIIATSKKQRSGNPIKICPNECHIHGEEVEVMCETCMELLCDTCVRQSHHENHETKKISEVAAENVNTLEIIKEELNHSELLLEENDESIEEAITKLRDDANRLEADIDGGATSVTVLLQEKVDYLHLKVKENMTHVEKKARDFSLQNTNLKHVTDYAKYAIDTLLAALGKSEMQRLVGVRDLSTKSKKIRKDIAALRNQLATDERELTLPSDIMAGAWIDRAKRGVERIGKQGQACVSLIRTFEHEPCGTLLGFVMHSLDDIYYVSHSSGKLSFTPVNPKLNVTLKDIDTHESNVMAISPTLGRGNYAFLFNSSERVKCPQDKENKKKKSPFVYNVPVFEAPLLYQYADLHHLTDPLFRIRAVSWDEFRQHCYVILNDNITIVSLKLGDPSREPFGGTLEEPSDDQESVKLTEPIYVTSNNAFHISTSGGMAICDTANGSVKYFTSVQSQVTKSIRSPPELAGGVPECIMSRNSDHKWFVFWDGTPESEFVGIYQYSDCFEIEQFVLNVSKVISFNFLNDRFLAVHKSSPIKEGYYDFQMFVLH